MKYRDMTKEDLIEYDAMSMPEGHFKGFVQGLLHKDIIIMKGW